MAARTPTLSIVVPFYDVEDYIGDCLESLRRQSLQDIEVVLVDDGSRDRSDVVAKHYTDLDPRFRLVRQENQGLGPARNTGVEHAGGAHVAFVDSDDLVPRRAYAQLVQALRRSGSSFAIGNARRFNRTTGVTPSWTHGIACAVDRTGTHVLERPELVADRMVWNKVYRRDFWDEFRYTFPPIRYEDYPVTLQAHLDAIAVDVLATPVYYWRVRESGDSITQQVFRPDNLRDRLRSAQLVLDLVDTNASPEVRARTHSYLAGIDLVALAQAFAVVPDEQVDDVVRLGQRFVARLDPAVFRTRSKLDLLQYHALRDGDAALLRELAAFRADGGLVGGVRAHRNPRVPGVLRTELPGRGRSSAPRRTFALSARALRLTTTVTGLRWEGRRWCVRGTAEITHLATGPDSQLTVSVVDGVRRWPVPVRRFVAVDQHSQLRHVGFEVVLDPLPLLNDTVAWPLRLEVSMQVAGYHRTGMLTGMRPGSPVHAPGCWVGDSWLQPAPGRRGALSLNREREPVVLREVRAESEEFVLTGQHREPLGWAHLVVARPLPVGDLVVPAVVEGSRFEARVAAAELLRDVSTDDPFTSRTRRAVRLESDRGTDQLLWPQQERVVGIAGPSHDGERRVVRLLRSPYNLLNVLHGPPELVADRVRLARDGTVTVEGASFDRDAILELAWRRFLPDSDRHVEAACEVEHADGRWRATVPGSALVPAHELPAVPWAPAADWTLFRTDTATAQAVDCGPSAAAMLPAESASTRVLTLTTRAETLHLEVR